MCWVSNVSDNYYDKWKDRWPYWPKPIPATPLRPLTDEEIEEFRKVLEQAKQRDIDEKQPACEHEEKIKRIKELVKNLGKEIDFL